MEQYLTSGVVTATYSPGRHKVQAKRMKTSAKVSNLAFVWPELLTSLLQLQTIHIDNNYLVSGSRVQNNRRQKGNCLECPYQLP